MHARMFTLVNAEDHAQVFAWGLEIVGDGYTEAIVYRRDPATRSAAFGAHESAEAALKRYAHIAPMALVWEEDDDFSELSLPGDPVEAAGPAHPQP